jgi:hypothetical protein
MLPLVAIALIGTPLAERPSYLFQMDVGPNHQIRLEPSCYHAQAGDIVLFDDHPQWADKLYRFCGTAAPFHAGIVFRQRDGSWAILEAGTNAVWKIFVFDLDERLHGFDGTILIRRLRTSLNKEQSNQLTEFCLAQEGKKYALGRLILQGTPLRAQGTWRRELFGRTVLDRDRWICSELVVAAATVAGVLDPQNYPANAMYPRDLCYDERYDLSPHYESAALWSATRELQFVGNGVRTGK